MDAATDAEIARLLAEDQGYYFDDFGGGGGRAEDSDSDPDYGRAKKKTKKAAGKKGTAASKAAPASAPAQPQPGVDGPPGQDGGDEFSATGRRKRKDTGAQRTAARAWSDDEERLFLEALALHGRDWKQCAEHIGSRDSRAVASHAQKFLIKALLRGEELPGRMVESGRGYTLSGKPLDPNSAAARAYGLRPDAFKRVVESGFLEVGVHVTSLEMVEDPQAPKPREPKQLTAPPKRTHKPAQAAAPSTATDAAVFSFEAPALEPTEYAKNRPRRQVASAKAHLGHTTESLDLTTPQNFVGPPGSGAPLSQPFSVTISSEALLVMDFHAHLSGCEIIGLLGGTFDPDAKKLNITAAYPCRRAPGSDSSTSVELDAESQVEVTCEMDDQGLIPVGWYHSHPVFEPRPSAKDNENQRNYQALCRDQTTGLEPWVGAIMGPYDDQLPTPASQVQLWVVRQQGKGLTPYNVRATRTPPTAMPGEAVERQLELALEQLKDDPGRISVADIWRPYARIIQGQPQGDPMNFADKIRAALRVHMPQDHAPEIAAFFRRLEDQFMQQWGTELPAPRHPALLPAAEAPVSAEAEAPTVDGAPTPAAAPEPQAIAGDSVPAPAEAQPAACEGPQPGSEAATAAAAAVPVVDSPSGGSASARDEQVDPNQPQDAIAKEAPPSCANAAAGKPEEDAAGDAQAAEAREMEPKNEKGS